jgi:orotate phosphoribosyltransferase
MAAAMRDTAPETVAGPTTGGVLLAFVIGHELGVRGIFAERAEGGGRSFQRDFHLEAGERVLVVDDVLTSGASINDTLAAVRAAGGEPVGVAVMVDRSNGAVTFGDLPLFAATQVEMQTFEPEACPLCARNVPLKVT